MMKRWFASPALLVAFHLVAQDAKPVEAKSLGLQEAVQIALKNNLQVGISETTRDFNQASVQVQEGQFDWTLGGSANWRKDQDASTGPAYRGGPIISSASTTYSRNLDVNLQKPFEWGGTLKLDYNPTYSVSKFGQVGGEQNYLSYNAPYDGSFSATYTQSLIRGFGRDNTAAQLMVARNGAVIADLNYQKAIIDLIASVESAYWDVVFAKENLANKQQSLEIAQKQLNENKIRVQVGTLAPIEVTSAEAAVAQREQDIISAEAQYLNAKDALSRALFPQMERIPVEPSEMPKVAPVTQDEAVAERMALANRVELKAAKLDLESKRLLEKQSNNGTLPKLDLSVGYAGGAANDRTIGPVNSDLTHHTYPGYNVGFVFSVPLMNKGARGVQAQARANRRQGEYSVRDQELSILLEVRQSLRNLQAAEKGVAAAVKTREFQEKTLDAEQKKFANGMSTNFFVLQRQSDLDLSRSAELQARINYAKAVTTLEKAIGHLPEARNLRF
jgi:outer membrane protein TolC